MSDITADRLAIDDIIARIERQQAETRKFVAEQTKLIEESQKLNAENLKLTAERIKLAAEGRKLGRDRWLAPVIAAASIITSCAAIIGAAMAVYATFGHLAGHGP